MPSSDLLTIVGQSYALLMSAGAVSGPLFVTGNPLPDSCYLLNPSATAVAVTFQQITVASPPAGFRFPIQNAPTIVTSVILPALMQTPLQVRTPQGGFSAFGVAASQGATTVYFMPSTIQT